MNRKNDFFQIVNLDTLTEASNIDFLLDCTHCKILGIEAHTKGMNDSKPIVGELCLFFEGTAKKKIQIPIQNGKLAYRKRKFHKPDVETKGRIPVRGSVKMEDVGRVILTIHILPL